jgi:HlyD family secretion protein
MSNSNKPAPSQSGKHLALAALAVALLGLTIFAFSRSHQATPDGLVYTNGRLEADRVAIASKVPGRVLVMLHQEGDSVAAGEVLARLDDSLLRPKAEQAAAAVKALEAQLAARRAEVEVARSEAPLGIAASEAQLARAAASAQQARRDAERLSQLERDGAIDAHHAEQARLASTAADTQLEQARQQLAQSRLAPARVDAKATELGALAGQLDAARAQLREAEAALAETEIRAPSAGVVAVRAREPGEVVGAGGTLFELYDPAQLYLRAYVPETEVGRLKLGQAARVWVDAAPDIALEASLTNIANRAEFTPKEVQTRDERAKQVFGIKLLLKPGAKLRLAPGLPADAAIAWRDGVTWRAPR